MTDKTTTVKGLKDKAAGSYHASPWGSAVLDGALLSWLGGIALNKGFGVSVPFIAGWLLLGGLVLLVFTLADAIASANHKQAIKAAPFLAAADVMAEEETRRYLDAQGFLDMDAKLRG